MELEEYRLERAAYDVCFADLGDKRLEQRFKTIMENLARNPRASLTESCDTLAQVRGAHRFTNNPKCSFHALLEHSCLAALHRAADSDSVLVIHDSSTFDFRHKPGLFNHLGRSAAGFRLHSALLLQGPVSRLPLGPAGAFLFPPGQNQDPLPGADEHPPLDWETWENQGARWLELIQKTEARFQHMPTIPIHVCDAEADDYKLWGSLVRQDSRFIIRAGQLRRRTRSLEQDEDAYGSLSSVLEETAVPRYEKTITIGPHPERGRQAPASRTSKGGRQARVAVRTATLECLRPRNGEESYPEVVRLNAVEIVEIEAPSDVEQPVRWVLLTNLSVESEEDVKFVVESYCARWVTEEYYDILKNHVGLMDSRVKSAWALLAHLAMGMALGWRILAMRSIAQGKMEGETGWWFDGLERLALEQLARKHQRHLDEHLSSGVALIAAMGGHVKHNGPPGVLTLSRGWSVFCAFIEGMALMKSILSSA